MIYNRLRDRMPLGIDATLRYGLHIPPTKSITETRAAELEPLQHPQALRAAADTDRQPGPRLARGGGPPGQRRLPLLRPHARHRPSRLLRERERLRRLPRHARLRAAPVTTHVALLGHPVAAVALAADAERRLRRGAARLALLGLRRRGAARRGRGAADARVRRRERDDPAQAGGRRRLRRGRRRGGQHARLPRRAGASASTPTSRSSPGSGRRAPA